MPTKRRAVHGSHRIGAVLHGQDVRPRGAMVFGQLARERRVARMPEAARSRAKRRGRRMSAPCPAIATFGAEAMVRALRRSED
jgi:hypothetical protein